MARIRIGQDRQEISDMIGDGDFLTDGENVFMVYDTGGEETLVIDLSDASVLAVMSSDSDWEPCFDTMYELMVTYSLEKLTEPFTIIPE